MRQTVSLKEQSPSWARQYPSWGRQYPSWGRQYPSWADSIFQRAISVIRQTVSILGQAVSIIRIMRQTVSILGQALSILGLALTYSNRETTRSLCWWRIYACHLIVPLSHIIVSTFSCHRQAFCCVLCQRFFGLPLSGLKLFEQRCTV